MESSTQNRANKRSYDDDHKTTKDKKMKCLALIIHESVYKFRILLPNSVCLSLRIVDPPGNLMPVVVFADKVRDEYDRLSVTELQNFEDIKRKIHWDSPDLCFLDVNDNKLETVIDFSKYETNKSYTLRLNDGGKGEEVYENMWDLTPDVELLRELPQEYAFETALADLIDNSLQAVWSKSDKSRLICVDIREDKLSVFDNGPGMDASEENSIVKWGKMGSSLHRSSRGQAIGGKPPYLKPFFGMFGYGGPVSSMHLGRRTIISSKTKNSRKVCTLHLQRDALLKSSGTDKTWQANGGLRDPSKAEMKLSPDGSFTKVEIFELKMRSLHVDHLRCKLKDIYFPYIQCDDISKTGRTIMPIEFQVNGIDLTEVEGGEVAVTNLNSCNGPEFVLQLHFTTIQEPLQKSPGRGASSQEANARLKCLYFPIVQGKENIERILEKLEAEGCGVAENFESFSRVSLRCLGRLLPDARWAWLPFMEPKQRKVDKAQTLKRCCSRVKCFIETDGGFYPTPSKTDLSHHHPFTIALKNFGSKHLEKERDAHVEIFKEGKKITLQQMDKLYQDWIFEMHDKYDEESDCGVDNPVIIINPSNKKLLGISSDVIRIHKLIQRKGKLWKSGQKIKVLKGACAGVHKNNIYAQLEYILLEGFQGDAGGESRIICRPVDVSNDKGCLVSESKDGNPTIDIRQSKSLPISVIDSGKCLSMDTTEWNSQLEKLQQKIPSSIDVLSTSHCEEVDAEGSLPSNTLVNAGYALPDEVIAVVRPASYNMASKYLDQKHIAVTDFDMVLEIKFSPEDTNLHEKQHIRSHRASPSSRKGFRGLYIFKVNPKLIFEKAGEYTLSFQIKDSNFSNYVRRVRVKALSQVKRWGIVSDTKCAILGARVGSCFPPISVACYDFYENRTTFSHVPEVIVKVLRLEVVLFQSEKIKPRVSSNKLYLTVENLLVESSKLDHIRPSYEAELILCSEDKSLDVTIPCQVLPGFTDHLIAKPADFMKQLLPGNIVQELVLEVFDAWGNHVKEDSEMLLDVDGFYLQQKTKRIRVDACGCVDLSGLLKVAKGYGETVSLSVLSNEKIVFQEMSQTEMRMIRVATKIPESCVAGSQLENVEFEIVSSNGIVDETINDNEKGDIPHTLSLKSDSGDIDDSVRYSFRNGRCTVRFIPIPHIEGSFSFCAAHSRYSKLNTTITVHVEPSLTMSHESIHPQYTGEMISLDNPYCSITPKVEYENITDVLADRAIVPVKSPNSAKNVQNIVEILYNEKKELEVKILECGSYIGEHERKLDILQKKRLTIEKDLSEMQDLMDPISVDDSSHLREKETMQREIEMKSHSAASIVCKILKNEKRSDIYKDIVGVVALLGTVQTNELSRVLAEFLGEETMLSVVCKNYKAADDLEAGDSSAFASVDGRYNVICLEDIRPYEGSYSKGDPQRMLLLSDPALENGKSPAGFLGYAVNMLYLDAHELYTRISCDKGLRETLLYHLFGELQVYTTRENMRKALQNSCIQSGAVSLDGGIIRGHGVLSLGRCEPSVRFPVVEPQQYSSPMSKDSRIQRLFESKKSMLRSTINEIERETESIDQGMKKFGKYSEKLTKFYEEKAPFLKNLSSQEFCSMESNPTPQSDFASSS